MAGALTVDSGLVSLNKANTIGSVALAGGVLAFGKPARWARPGHRERRRTARDRERNPRQRSSPFRQLRPSPPRMERRSPKTRVCQYRREFNAEFRRARTGWRRHLEYRPRLCHHFAIHHLMLSPARSRSGTACPSIRSIPTAQPTTVDGGATLDLAGFGLSLTNLLGGGAVIDSGAAATLTLAAANFSGAISGPLSLVSNGAVVLSGATPIPGPPRSIRAESFQLGVGRRPVRSAGAPSSTTARSLIERNNAVTLTNAISGAGTWNNSGPGVTSINTANTYTGGTTFSPPARSPSAMPARWEPARS